MPIASAAVFFLLAVLVLGTATIVTALLWRRFRWPCPPWLVPLLENPYVGALLGADKLLARAGVGPGMRVLDVGSGPGRLAIPAARLVGPGGSVVAVDLEPAMLERLDARARAAGLANVETVHAAAGEGRLPAGGFDHAFLVTVLGEIERRPEALAEIHAALKPGGLLTVGELIPDPHYQSRRAVRRMAAAAGFEERAAHGTWLAFTLHFARR